MPLDNPETSATENTPQGTQEAPQGTGNNDPLSWYDELPDDAKAHADRYTEAQVSKLKTTLDKVRDENKAIQKQLKELASKPVDASQWEAKIAELNSTLAESTRLAKFYEAAADVKELPASRYSAAYKIAKIDGLIDDDGDVDWTALQKQHDYLFGTPAAAGSAGKGNAGSGLAAKPQPKTSMNDLIRG